MMMMIGDIFIEADFKTAKLLRSEMKQNISSYTWQSVLTLMKSNI